MSIVLFYCVFWGTALTIAALVRWTGRVRVPKRNPFEREIPPGTYHAILQKLNRSVK